MRYMLDLAVGAEQCRLLASGWLEAQADWLSARVRAEVSSFSEADKLAADVHWQWAFGVSLVAGHLLAIQFEQQ